MAAMATVDRGRRVHPELFNIIPRPTEPKPRKAKAKARKARKAKAKERKARAKQQISRPIQRGKARARIPTREKARGNHKGKAR